MCLIGITWEWSQTNNETHYSTLPSHHIWSEHSSICNYCAGIVVVIEGTIEEIMKNTNTLQVMLQVLYNEVQQKKDAPMDAMVDTYQLITDAYFQEFDEQFLKMVVAMKKKVKTWNMSAEFDNALNCIIDWHKQEVKK